MQVCTLKEILDSYPDDANVTDANGKPITLVTCPNPFGPGTARVVLSTEPRS